jgi:hypothetical protein
MEKAIVEEIIANKIKKKEGKQTKQAKKSGSIAK